MRLSPLLRLLDIMASPNIDSLFPLILPEVNQCPLDMVRLAVRRAARKFCQQSSAWRLILPDAVTLVADVGQYALVVPDGAEIIMQLNVYRPLGELTGKTLDQIRLLIPDWQSAVGAPRFFNTLDFSTLSIYPAAGDLVAGEQYKVRVALAPKLTIADLPEELALRYDEALAEGALSLLFGMKDRPWASPARVPDLSASFDRKAWEAHTAMLHERTSGVLVAESVEFGL